MRDAAVNSLLQEVATLLLLLVKQGGEAVIQHLGSNSLQQTTISLELKVASCIFSSRLQDIEEIPVFAVLQSISTGNVHRLISALKSACGHNETMHSIDSRNRPIQPSYMHANCCMQTVLFLNRKR